MTEKYIFGEGYKFYKDLYTNRLREGLKIRGGPKNLDGSEKLDGPEKFQGSLRRCGRIK